MLGLTLPDWIDPDNARTIALVIGLGALVLAVLVLRFVQKMVMKIAFTAVLALIALLAWTQRADLADCAKTCECNLLGVRRRDPAGSAPAQLRLRGLSAAPSLTGRARGAARWCYAPTC